MKITFVLPYAGLAGGIRVAAIYAKLLQRRGHDVFVISIPKKQLPFRRKAKSFLLGQGWPGTSKGSPFLDGTGVPHRVIESLRPITDADVPDADVVVATWWETAEWVWNLSASKGAKAYFIQHHEIHDNQPADRVRATWRLPMQKITISQWLMRLAVEEYGDPSTILIPNSVDMEQFHAPPRGKQRQPTVGLLYSDIPWKGLETSRAALDTLAAKIPNLRVISFGELSEPTILATRCTDYWCSPAQNRIREIYSQCDVWLCGSRAEGFHLPPLEAMACRCPVVSTRVGGPVDTIREGENGFLADVGDSATLAARLEQVLAMPEPQWRTMSDAAYATARGYSWDDATDLFEAALIKSIASQRSGTSSTIFGRNQTTQSAGALLPR